MRLFIYGSPGAGKTTLANTIARTTGHPVIHRADLFHFPKGGDRPRANALASLDRLTAGPSWIAEGNTDDAPIGPPRSQSSRSAPGAAWRAWCDGGSLMARPYRST